MPSHFSRPSDQEQAASDEVEEQVRGIKRANSSPSPIDLRVGHGLGGCGEVCAVTQDKNTPAGLGLSAGHLQQIEEETCDCGAAGSGEGHTDWCKFVALGSWMERSGLSFATTLPPALEGVEEELRALLEKATPQPWVANLHHTKDYAGRTHAFVMAGSVVPLAAVVLAAEGCDQEEGRANARLIVAARNHLPALLSALAGMREENGRLHKELRSHVIFRPFGRGEEGTCVACDSAWKDGAETHRPGCLAVDKP